MSSSYVVEPQDSGSEKKDDTLIIVVNDDGTISVDQETLQSLIMNQANANVSVVRVGQAETDAENGDITLTVDPPPFTPATVNSSGTTDAGGLVDPFMEMDPEQLERLETALQSEEAKQILGENVTAMLDMLTVEEQQNSIRYSVELDHCYTSRLSPSDPKPRDPLPVTDSPIAGDNVQYARQISPSRGVSGLSSSSGDYENTNVTKPKILAKTVKQVGRPRKSMPSTSIGVCGNSRSAINITGTPKLSGHPIPRNVTSAIQHGIAKSQGRSHEEEEDEPTSPSSESSESEPPSDNDSDFGPRGPRRGGSSVRARGGRKGLTTRGGSMAAARRRGTNKHMDMEQVRRLDMEMAAAVNAMKSPEKDDKSGGFSPVKGKRQFKTAVGRKKEESPRIESSSIVNEDTSAIVYEKPLQTTNQVKANLINANMIKGDMILTKPGQGKTNQKVTFVQKQVLMKPNELKSIGIKKQMVLPKGKFLTQGGTKFFATKDGKLLQVPMTTKTVTSNVPVTQIKASLPQSSPAQQQQQPTFIQNSTTQLQQQQQMTKVTSPTTPSKAKLCEPKKEKRKSDGGLELQTKTEIDPGKITEAKLLEGAKKHQKKEPRKSPAYVVDTLGPALFSTPDIIRRVGSNGDSKTTENTVTSPNSATPSTSTAGSSAPSSQPTTPPPSTRAPNLLGVTAPVTSIATLSETAQCSLANSTIKGIIAAPTSTEQTAPVESQLTGDVRESDTSIASGTEEEQKLSTKPNLPEELQPSLDSGSIEGEEHLLATLEMEASKHEEELLAEALLLQEELGVDLTDHPALVEQGGGVASETLTTAANMLIPTLITTEQAEMKPSDAVTTHAPIAVATISAPVTDIAAAISSSVTTVTPATLATISTLTPVTSSTVTMASVANVMRELAKKATKDDKEPIQIVRGGRVITLPPIEAPATRSKRLQAKVDLPQKILEPVKRTEKFNIQTIPQKSHLTKAEVHFDINAEEEEEEEEDEEEEDQEDEEEEDDDEEDNSDSEDDPDRLWCICKRPHNNRFMICCDVCEDWFHGKCVHVSKAMGQQMEEKGIEWVCPNCAKKKSEEAKMKATLQAASGKQRIVQLEHTDEDSVTLKNLPSSCETASLADVEETPSSILPPSDYGNVQYSGTMQCVVCKKEARNSSIYCSDACILAHAQETLTKDKPSPSPAVSPKTPRSMPFEVVPKPKPETRVIVFERKTGRVLTGADAPTRSNLKTWLKENPTFEVVGANNLNTLQIGKPVTTVQSQVPGKTGKFPAFSSGKTQTLQKMVYTKVPGSKQMILTAGNRKYTVISSGQHQQQQQNQGSNAKTIQLKQTLLTHPGKSPFILKTSTGKSVIQIQPKVQNVVLPKQQPNNKKQEIKQPVSQQKVQVKQSPAKKPEPEPIRLNIRKTLTELLSSRIKETEDLKLSDEEIGDLAFNIELEMYKYFKDTGAKYKAKYRSLVFNIKDTKNLTLFRKIADRSLTPDAVVRLSPDEMASQELAEWREKETKHQLEMIKKNELDLMAQAKSIVVKTHKGEQIIENDGGIDHVDPKTPVQDIVTALNSGDGITSTIDEIEKEMERERANDEDRGKLKGDTKKMKNLDEKRRKDKEKDKDRDREREKERGREKESGGRSKGRHDRSTSRGRHRHGRDDREHSKTREKSRERKSARNKESRREKEKERERERERTKDRDRSKIREKGNKEKTRQKEKDRERHRGGENGSRSRSSFVHGDAKETEKRDEERKRDTDKKDDQSGSAGSSSTEKPIEDRLWRHIEDEATTNTIDGNDSDVSDREPTSTVTIKTPDINEELEKEREQESMVEREPPKGGWQTVWRGFVNMVDVAKFFITAQEVSGQAKDLMEDLPDTVDVVGRISHETVWDYISKMKKTGSKEILVIRLTAANDEEKIPYITLYSYLNSRSRLGVVGNVSKNIKDFYIMPFSSQSKIPPVLLPLNGPGFEEQRPHLLLGIIVRNKRKRLAGVSSSAIPSKLSKKDADRSYTPPLLAVPKDKSITASSVAAAAATPTTTTTGSSSPALPAKPGSMLGLGSTDSTKDKHHSVTQITLESLNKAHIGMSRSSMLDTAAICKIVPELSSKLDLTSSPSKPPLLDDDGDEPYSPGGMDDDDEVNLDLHTSLASSTAMSMSMSMSTGIDGSTGISSSKNSSELQRKMEELNRQIEEQKQQIQSISSSFLGESTSTLPGLGLDPPAGDECEEAYSPTDSRSFTPPPPPGISKFTQPILEKVSNITIPPNLQEILANVKRQESSKVDPYLPSKPSATFLTTVNSSIYQNSEKYTPMSLSKSNESRVSSVSSGSSRSSPDITSLESTQQVETSIPKESKSTLSTLSDLDLIRKAEEELAAVAAASTVVSPAAESPSISTAQPAISLPSLSSTSSSSKVVESPHLESSSTYKNTFADSFKRNFASEQPKPPGLEDEEFPPFPSTPPSMQSIGSNAMSPRSKFVPKSGIILSVKRKAGEESESSSPSTPTKTPRIKSRWGQGPSDSVD